MSGSVLNLFFTDDQVVNIKYFSTRCVPQIRDAATAIENLRQEEIDKSYVKGLQISDIVQLRDKSIEAARSLGALEGWKDKLNPALPDISKRVVGFCKETIQIIEKLPSINALALKDFTEETVKSMPGCSLSTEELDKVRVVGERIEELKGNIAGSHKTVSEFQAAITTFKQLINVEVLPRLSRIYDLFVAAGVGAEVRALSQLIQRKSDEFHFELSKLKILDNDADIAVVNARIDAKIKEIEVEIAKKELLVIVAKNGSNGLLYELEDLGSACFYMFNIVKRDGAKINYFEALWINTLELISSSKTKVDGIKDTNGMLLFKLRLSGIMKDWDAVVKDINFEP